jgi:hypothetical protein
MQQPAFYQIFWLHDDFVACLTPLQMFYIAGMGIQHKGLLS